MARAAARLVVVLAVIVSPWVYSDVLGLTRRAAAADWCLPGTNFCVGDAVMSNPYWRRFLSFFVAGGILIPDEAVHDAGYAGLKAYFRNSGVWTDYDKRWFKDFVKDSTDYGYGVKLGDTYLQSVPLQVASTLGTWSTGVDSSGNSYHDILDAPIGSGWTVKGMATYTTGKWYGKCTTGECDTVPLYVYSCGVLVSSNTNSNNLTTFSQTLVPDPNCRTTIIVSGPPSGPNVHWYVQDFTLYQKVGSPNTYKPLQFFDSVAYDAPGINTTYVTLPDEAALYNVTAEQVGAHSVAWAKPEAEVTPMATATTAPTPDVEPWGTPIGAQATAIAAMATAIAALNTPAASQATQVAYQSTVVAGQATTVAALATAMAGAGVDTPAQATQVALMLTQVAQQNAQATVQARQATAIAEGNAAVPLQLTAAALQLTAQAEQATRTTWQATAQALQATASAEQRDAVQTQTGLLGDLPAQITGRFSTAVTEWVVPRTPVELRVHSVATLAAGRFPLNIWPVVDEARNSMNPAGAPAPLEFCIPELVVVGAGTFPEVCTTIVPGSWASTTIDLSRIACAVVVIGYAVSIGRRFLGLGGG